MATWKKIITDADDSNYKNSNLVAGDLPLATTSAVGGISVGSGLSVTAGGELSADSQSGTVQTLSISGQTLSLSDNGGSVTLPDSDTQDLSISGREISLTNGGSVTVPSSNVTTDLSVATSTTTVTVESSDGTDATVPVATTSIGGVMSASMFDEHTANNAKVSCTESAVSSILAGLDENDTLYIGDSGNDADIHIRGDLTVSGTTTTVNTSTLDVADNLITLNSDVTGTPSESAGIVVERGTGANASINWAENADKWFLDYDGQKAPIAVVVEATTAPGSTDTTVQGAGNFWHDTNANVMYVQLD